MAKYFVSKNNRKEKDTHPDFILSQVPEQDGGKWIEVGALWKSKSGKGYNVKFGDNVTVIVKPREFTKPEGLNDDEAFENFEKSKVEKPAPKEINVGGSTIPYPQEGEEPPF